MDRFLDIALSFPTLILSLLLMVAVGYWLLALLGLFDLEVVDLPDAGDGIGSVGLLSGLFLKLRMEGLPFALIFTAVVTIAWVFMYYASYFVLLGIQPAGLKLAMGLLSVPVALIAALPFAGLVLQPVRGLFARSEGRQANSLVGEIVLVRSPEVTESSGTADFADGGADLIIQVRTSSDALKRGDRALIVEYLAASNAYRVVPP